MLAGSGADTQLLKQQLMDELSTWIADHHLKRAEAADHQLTHRHPLSLLFAFTA